MGHPRGTMDMPQSVSHSLESARLKNLNFTAAELLKAFDLLIVYRESPEGKVWAALIYPFMWNISQTSLSLKNTRGHSFLNLWPALTPSYPALFVLLAFISYIFVYCLSLPY